jgi:hypothetical protein
MVMETSQNGVQDGRGSQEPGRGSRASRGLSGGHEKAGECSPALEMVVESGPGFELVLSTNGGCFGRLSGDWGWFTRKENPTPRQERI